MQKTKVKLIINGIKSYISSQSEIKKRLSSWNSDAFSMIEMPNIAATYNLQFSFLRNDEEVGKARCSLLQGRNKKDCLDVADSQFNIVGKFLFEVIWRSGGGSQPVNNTNYSQNMYAKQPYNNSLNSRQQQQFQGYPTYSEYQNPYVPSNNLNQPMPVYYKAPNFNEPYFKNIPLSQQTQETTYVKSQGQMNKKDKKKSSKSTFEQLFGGCVGCTSYKNRNKNKMNYFAIEPIVILDSELPYAENAENIEPFSIQYFSKRL